MHLKRSNRNISPMKISTEIIAGGRKILLFMGGLSFLVLSLGGRPTSLSFPPLC